MINFKQINDLHNLMKEQQIDLIYEGEFNQEITKLFTNMTEKNLSDTGQEESTKRKVFHVMVECLQNICKHASPHDIKQDHFKGSGVFIVGHNDLCYFITSGNKINTESKNKIYQMLTRFNSLKEDEIKEEYKRLIKESRLSSKGGAGLGFIDIIKKTGNKINFHFEEIANQEFFFILQSTISKK